MRLIFVVLFLATSTVSGRSHGHSRHGGGSSHHSYGGSHSGYGSGGHTGYGSGGHTGYGSGGTHSYPGSSGLSGNKNSGHTQQHNVHNSYSSRSEVHHHYHYNPPQQIVYGSTYHPVYVGHPPVYVYEYRNSGSRFDSLLTGLALYNLGRNSHYHHYSSDRQYSSSPGEMCKLAVSKSNGEYEEARIDCNLMSSFILDGTSSTTQNDQHVVKNTTQVTVTQTVNGTGNSSVSTKTVTSSTVEDALKVKGPSIAVTPGMTCYLIRTFRDSTTLRKPVDCGLLQEYSRSSLQRSGAQALGPVKTIIFNFLIIYLVGYLRQINYSLT